MSQGLSTRIYSHDLETYELKGFAQFVGFFTAHAVSMLEEGENVIPLIAAYKKKEAVFERVESSTYEKAVAAAKKRMRKLQKESDYIFLAIDGFLTLGDKKYEAIFIEAFKPKSKKTSTIHLAVPYRSAKSQEDLAIYKPKVIRIDIPDLDGFFSEFYKGVGSHVEAAKFWDMYLDESQ